jgi:hypothetical protein
LKILFTSFTKQATLIIRSTVLSLPLQLVFPAYTYGMSRVCLLDRVEGDRVKRKREKKGKSAIKGKDWNEVYTKNKILTN